ncbi:MAG: ExbD/TolR family protein [Novosphingobium sp.]
MAMLNSARAQTPFSAINTTPLIDVLLVLLIMLVITVPVATHQLDFDLPAGRGAVDARINRVEVTAGDRILWNGTQVTEAELAANLKLAGAMVPEPALQYRPEPEAGYELSARVLSVIKRSQVTNFGFVGNEQFSEFGKPPAAK